MKNNLLNHIQIFNIGKTRTFSSIPRVEKTTENYTYEILRLDDPLALAIGTLTDCCQELGNAAEMCVEHSMVDKNGRVFVVRDADGQPIAQSWVWRNKNVVCFDNIEIPDKAFKRAVKEDPLKGRKNLTSDIYDLYKMAAKDLIAEDERVYKQLLEEGKITQEQYDGLKVSRVMVGLGYNDIAERISNNSDSVKDNAVKPLDFEPIIPLSRGLYTNDSIDQYILEETDYKNDYNGETLAVHNDHYLEYSDENMKQQQLLTLGKLDLVTEQGSNTLQTALAEFDSEETKPVSLLAVNYGLNPETTRIVMNSNFAIVLDRREDKITIADLLFNTKIDNGVQQIDISPQVEMQINIALNQLMLDGNELNIDSLSMSKREMFEKAISLSDEIDIERGVSSGTR